MRTIVFDIRGPYGHFRKPYAPASPVTYPFPPPPAVLGIVGAILGLGKDEYHRALGWETIRIGIRLLRPARFFSAALNLVNTKADWWSVKSRIQIPYQFLKDPAFRIYVADLPRNQADRLSGMLKAGRSVYTPSLGLAQCLAQTVFVADATARPAMSGATTAVVPLGEKGRVRYEAGRRYERVRIPARMGPGRTVTRYCQAVCALDADARKPLTVEGLELFEVNHESIAFF